MRRSRVTLANMDAAAIDFTNRSPLMMPRCGTSSPGIVQASTNRWSGCSASASTARRIANSPAWRIFNVEISSTDAEPTPQAIARSWMSGNNSSRAAGESNLLSRIIPKRESNGKIAAPATTGPANAPHPASSTPAINRKPAFHKVFSTWNVGGRIDADSIPDD